MLRARNLSFYKNILIYLLIKLSHIISLPIVRANTYFNYALVACYFSLIFGCQNKNNNTVSLEQVIELTGLSEGILIADPEKVELKEKFRDFYFNFLPHMENYTFSVFDGLEVTEDFKNNFEETLNLYSQILVFIDVLPVVEINPSDDWLEDFENVVGTEVEQYEDFFPIEDGDVVVDFRASTGIFSIPASEKAKMVYAVEPFPNMIDVIKTRVKNIDNIEEFYQLCLFANNS